MSITAARRELAAILTAAAGDGVTVLDHVPEELPAPCVVLDAADDYLDRADTFGTEEWWLTLRVYALVDVVGNAQALEDLEGVLAGILPALAASAWEVEGPSRPQPFHTLEWLAYGAAITVRNLVTIPASPTTTPGETP